MMAERQPLESPRKVVVDRGRSPWGLFCCEEMTDDDGQVRHTFSLDTEATTESATLVIARPHSKQALRFGDFGRRLAPSGEVLAWLVAKGMWNLRSKVCSVCFPPSLLSLCIPRELALSSFHTHTHTHTFSLSLSLSPSLSLSHTHKNTHKHTQTRNTCTHAAHKLWTHAFNAASTCNECALWIGRIVDSAATCSTQRVLELGAGLGLPGMAAAAWADCSFVCISDGDAELVQVLRTNIANNAILGAFKGDVREALIEWREKYLMEDYAADEGLFGTYACSKQDFRSRLSLPSLCP